MIPKRREFFFFYYAATGKAAGPYSYCASTEALKLITVLYLHWLYYLIFTDEKKMV